VVPFGLYLAWVLIVGIASALAWRYALQRWVFRFENRLLAWFLSYLVMAALYGFSLWFLDFSGWNLKGGNEQPIKQVAGILFFLSPIGIPLAVGGPIVFFFDAIIAWRRSEEPYR